MDGSKSNLKCSGAFYIPELSQGCTLPSHCSNYDAELAAIIQALKWVLYSRENSIIISDSLSVLKAISNLNSNKSLLLKDFIDTMLLIQSHKIRITLAWIPCHVGISNNDFVDKTGKNYSSTPVDIPLDTSRSFIDNKIDILALAVWQDR